MKQTFKKLSAFMMALAISGTLFAQVPQKFNYQGIARDTKGNPMAQQRMTLKLTVLPTADATTGEYEEIQTVTTNEFGLYTLQIGNGTPVTGEMKAVKWETGNKYIKVAIDPKGGNDFVDAGTNQLLSVPYAIYADKAGMAKTAGGDRTGAVNSAAGHVAGDANYLTKFTGLNVIGKSLVFDNGVGVGIGTNAPIAGSTMHLKRTTNGNHLYMENPTATAFGAFRMINDVPANFFTFSKYGSTYPGGYTGIATLYPFANILGMGNNGPFLNASTGNMGMAITKAGTNKLKFHIHASTERIGIGGSSVPAAQVHFNNTDAGNDTIKFTNNTTGHTAADGTELRTNGNNTRLINRENGYTILGTNNTDRLAIDGTGNVGIGTTTPSTRLDVNGQVRIQGGAPGAGKVLTSDATGLATWTTPSITSVGGATNYIPKYTPNGTTLGNSLLLDNGTELLYNTNVPNTSINGLNAFTDFTFRGSKNAFVINKNQAGENQLILTHPTSNVILMGDSTRLQNGGLFDSVSFIANRFLDNKTFIGGYQGGLSIRNSDGRMENTSFPGSLNTNANFAINSSYDTAGHFTSSSTNGLYNGILRSEYTGTTVSDHVGVYGRSLPDATTNYGIGLQGVGGYYGVQGYSVITGSGNYGASGTAISNGSSYGLTGYAGDNGTLGGDKYGAYTYAAGGTNNYGLYTTVPAFAAGNGTGVYAQGKQTGVYGQADSASASQSDRGILFSVKEAIGVFGKGNSLIAGTVYKNIGVLGNSNATPNYWNIGVNAEASGGTYNWALLAQAPVGANNYAGYFVGDVNIAGNLAKSSGTFKIDHPQDPANKYLIHSFVESPDMMNVYNGNITTDANGIATVSLPSYFEAENKDFKYQLTVVDNSADFVMAKVSEKVSNNTFKIKTSKPNVEVSWQVTGVRQDAYANAHRIVDVVDKAPEDRGYYIHPELFGAPATQTVGPKGNPNAERHLLPSPEDHKKAMEEKKRVDDEHLQKQQEAQKNWKQQEAPKNTTKGTSGALAPTK